MQNRERYLTINQLAKACSISRASLLRMEQDGILEPAFVNPESGYRYYDVGSVLRVCRNMSLQELGITHKELKAYYSTPDNYQDLLKTLQRKMNIMEYHIENLRTQLRMKEHMELSHYYFPELYCYTEKMPGVTDPSTVRPNIWNVFNNAIDAGYSVDRRMHPFVLTDYKKMRKADYDPKAGYDYEICIPVLDNEKREGLVHFDATDSFSIVLYGGSSDMQKALVRLEKEFEDKKCKSADKVRMIAVVNSVPGEEIPHEYWVVRVSIPITDRK